MIRRNAEKNIDNWVRDRKNALLVTGARQVGKTYTIRECLKRSGRSFIELNLIEQPKYIRALSEADTIEDLKLNLSVATGQSLTEGETIIFIDEVQEYPDMITRIKFWVDDGRFRYIMSGSLLGVELRDARSAPVGYLDEIQMYPLGFEEFLLASGMDPDVLTKLERHFREKTPASDVIHDRMMDFFRRYLVVGGMPQAVNTYLQTGDMNAVSDVQKSIILQYKRDFTKYESINKKLLLEKIYDLIPAELLKQNRRFNYADIRKGLKFEKVEDSFLWLVYSGVALSCYNATEPRIALKQNEKSSLLKMYMSDVGLLTDIYGSSIKLNLLTKADGVNYGGIYENAVAMELKKNGYEIYYYNSRKLGELDFVIEREGKILPIEVKSGKDYYVHSAVSNVLKVSEFSIPEAIVFTNYNVRTEGKVTYYPVYMSMFLKESITLPVLDPRIV